MAVLENKTGFAGELFTAEDARGHLYVVLAIRGTFDIGSKGVVRRSELQEPLCMEDVYYGEPGKSSVKFASDLVLMKPGTDIIMLGTAYAPDGRPARRVTVGLKVGPLEKKVLVFGDRKWSLLMGVVPSLGEPEPFLKVPLVYERAAGGSDTMHENPSKHDWERRNPVGMGFRVHKPVEGLPLPNIEDPDDLIGNPAARPRPQGFGFIDRTWEPRASLAGTFDESWQKDQCPLPPADFDDRFFQAAHPDLIGRPYLRGDEPVWILGAVPEGVLEFRLPSIAIGVAVEYRHDNSRPRVALLDTVVLRPDERKLNLVWRSTIRCPRKIFDVELITAFTVHLKTALELMPEYFDYVDDPNAPRRS